MSKSKNYAEVYRALRPAAVVLCVVIPSLAFLVVNLCSYLDSVSQNSEPFQSEALFYVIVGLFVAAIIAIPIVAWIIKGRRNKKKEKSEREIAEIFIQQALMKYLSQFPDKNKQEFLNYLSQCPEVKRQEILLDIWKKYGNIH